MLEEFVIWFFNHWISKSKWVQIAFLLVKWKEFRSELPFLEGGTNCRFGIFGFTRLLQVLYLLCDSWLVFLSFKAVWLRYACWQGLVFFFWFRFSKSCFSYQFIPAVVFFFFLTVLLMVWVPFLRNLWLISRLRMPDTQYATELEGSGNEETLENFGNFYFSAKI